MHSDDKFWIIIWSLLATVIIAFMLLVYSYSIQAIPITEKRVISEHNLKLACIQRGGDWKATDNDNHPPYSCKMK